jgi:hypothetical protein
MQNLVFGIFFGVIGQVLSFFQLQAGIRFGWTEKWSWALMLLGFPISWSFMKSVKYFIDAFDGEIYPSRILGFAVGIIVFSILGWFLFREGISSKTAVCLLLSLCIILIQVLWK